MNTIPCIFCHKPSPDIALVENGYEGKKCHSCSLIYISPRPSASEIANLYGHDQAHLSAHDHITQEYPKRLHARHTLRIIQQYCRSGELLEIGSGAGYFLSEAHKAGFNPYGIELNRIQAEFITTHFGLPCSSEPLSDHSFGQQAFDVVYHSDVVSHFYDPIAAFKSMHAKLKPGGYVVFETGNIADIDPKYYGSFAKFQYPDHLFFFGQTSLNQLLEGTGFKLLKSYSYSILPQLYLGNVVRALRTFKAARHQGEFSGAQSCSAVQKDASNGVMSMVKNRYHQLMHHVRYGVGSYAPKVGRPQTLILVAQKK